MQISFLLQPHWCHSWTHATVATLPPGTLEHVHKQIPLEQCCTRTESVHELSRWPPPSWDWNVVHQLVESFSYSVPDGNHYGRNWGVWRGGGRRRGGGEWQKCLCIEMCCMLAALIKECGKDGRLTWHNDLSPFIPPLPSSQTYTADPQLEWTDVREWVVDTYPWQPSMNVNKLRTLNPEDVGWNHGECERVEGGRVGGW